VASKVAIATGAGTFDGLAAGPVSGRGVLLLHGFPEDLPALAAAGFRAVAFDQRGYSSGVRPVEVMRTAPRN
jgi:pimeloyl-ACP methyl ester carboxylesterase